MQVNSVRWPAGISQKTAVLIPKRQEPKSASGASLVHTRRIARDDPDRQQRYSGQIL
jgi:hypothetical protein